MRAALVVLVLSLIAPLPTARAETPVKIPVILDCDLGDDIDDAFAVALALASPELEIRGITTVFGDAYTRAVIGCRLLHQLDRAEIPIASGTSPREQPTITGQFQYGLRPAFRKRPAKESAAEFIYSQLKSKPGEITLIAVGPLTNIAELLTKHPDCKPWIKRLLIMGGSVRVGYNDKPPINVEWNIKCDIKAAQTVFSSGVPLVVAPLDATTSLKFEEPLRRKLFGTGTVLTNQLWALYQLWGQPTPTLFDPVAVTLAFEEKFCTLEDLRIEVDDKGFTREVKEGKPNARVATAVKRDEYLQWYLERIASVGQKAPAGNFATPGKLVSRGNLPRRIHVVEDYETDIERRWWLAGMLETKNVPPGSKRACRGVLTNDFDDLMGVSKAIYTAVIFNPVPGPPMGPNTRLGFRYWLKGTSRLKVQIYTLSKGYHRHLTLTDLPQEHWQAGTVDMTQLRRPDGSGGPLSEDERIDDIQFYTDPGAELLIDDVVLYDAAGPEEKEPFPTRPIFTGWFDTGRQGKEWPGDFEIVAKDKPLTWKAAKSVPMPKGDKAWLRVSLRGERPVAEATRLRFFYFTKNVDAVDVILVNSKTRTRQACPPAKLEKDRWTELRLAVDGFKAGDKVDELHFVIPKEGELLIDDVLLYEPGK